MTWDLAWSARVAQVDRGVNEDRSPFPPHYYKYCLTAPATLVRLFSRNPNTVGKPF
jgi:hypothetical protein